MTENILTLIFSIISGIAFTVIGFLIGGEIVKIYNKINNKKNKEDIMKKDKNNEVLDELEKRLEELKKLKLINEKLIRILQKLENQNNENLKKEKIN